MTTEQFLETLAEPKLEVMKRLSLHMGPYSIRGVEDKLISAAHELCIEGWLRFDGSFYTSGATYYRFGPGDKLDMRLIKNRW